MAAGEIVVGVDGSPASLHAALWAARAAARHGAALTVLTAVDEGVLPRGHDDPARSARAQDAARDVLCRAAAHLDHVFPGHPVVRTDAVEGDLGTAVARRAGPLRMVVVGRGVHRPEGSPLGSTAVALALGGHGVTVVVPGTAAADAPRQVVLALPAEVDEEVVRVAVEEARAARCPLRVVHVTRAPAVVEALRDDWGAGEPWWAVAAARVDARVAPAAAEAGVPVSVHVAEGAVPTTLLSQVTSHDELVVGGRRHRPGVARTWGSVVDQVLRRSVGVVVVVHPARRDRGRRR
ncbi:universal stress protein [Cellulosimicrobium funkei]|uniref:universal stress protein n=1 Tax=Cellulosimicrobium funkei TaxID=264251 RepID=UPI00343300B6